MKHCFLFCGAPGCTFSNVELKNQTWKACNKNHIFWGEFSHEILGLSLYWESNCWSTTSSSNLLSLQYVIKMYKNGLLWLIVIQKWLQLSNRRRSNLFILPGPVCEISPVVWGWSTFPVAVTMTTRHKRITIETTPQPVKQEIVFSWAFLFFLSLMKHHLWDFVPLTGRQ